MDVCKIDGCDKPVRVKLRQLCSSHYQIWVKENKPRGKKPCAVADCEGVMYARGYCNNHYAKYLKYGVPERPEAPQALCKECGEPAANRKRELCKNHYAKGWYDGRDGDTSQNWLKETVSYSQAHSRVKAVRGRASTHQCVTCGRAASDWALSADVPTGRLHFGKISKARPALSAYSLDVFDYLPMCKEDHRSYDTEHGNRSYKLQESRWKK